MAFNKWKDVPEIQEAFDKLENSSRKYFQLIESGSSDDRVQAQKVWANMSSSYWEILFALVDAQTQKSPDQLNFDEEEKLFIDLGCVPGVLNLKSDFDLFFCIDRKNFIHNINYSIPEVHRSTEFMCRAIHS